MISVYQRKFEYEINAPVNFVYGHFNDLRKFGELHPYMTEVTKLDENTYRIKEKVMLFGFIPMKPVYEAKVFETDPGKNIFYTSDVKKGVGLKINFEFKEDLPKGMTLVIETIEVTAGKITAGMFLDLMQKAHKITLTNLMNITKNKTFN
jgi:hypothetical protein